MDSSYIESKIKALTLHSDSQSSCIGGSKCYDSLNSVSAQDGELRKKLHQERLTQVLRQFQKERDDVSFSRSCLFCKQHFSGNRSFLFTHLMEQHNFHVGSFDNVVFGNELLDTLEQMLKDLKCFYCEKIFKDWMTLKEHMRKKQHKMINPKNKTFDRYYIINYLELDKTWTDVQEEEDGYSQEESDGRAEIMEWQDTNSNFVCLFCESKFSNLEDIFCHMKGHHHFDFKDIKQSHKLDFYKQVKLINYIRRKVFEKKCMYCDEQFSFNSDLITHAEKSGHLSLLPHLEKWDQTMYYFSTFENDDLLCALDDDNDDSQCQNETVVYPEDTFPPTSTLLQDENLRKTLL